MTRDSRWQVACSLRQFGHVRENGLRLDLAVGSHGTQYHPAVVLVLGSLRAVVRPNGDFHLVVSQWFTVS